MGKFKKGDLVRIKSARKIKELIKAGDPCLFLEPMEAFCDKMYPIEKANQDHTYYLGDDTLYSWQEEWLELCVPIQNFKVGDKVKIKSVEEIQSIYNPTATKFVPDMHQYCGNTYTIRNVRESKTCILEGIEYVWRPEWLTFVESKHKFSIGDFAVIKPNLIANRLEGDERVIPEMVADAGKIVTIAGVFSNGITYLVNENTYVWSDNMLLTVEEAFQPGTIVRKADKQRFSNDSYIVHVHSYSDNIVWLKETGTHTYLTDKLIVVVALPDKKILINHQKSKNDGTPKNENQLQGEESLGQGPSSPTVRRLRSRRNQVAISFGHLSNKTRLRSS